MRKGLIVLVACIFACSCSDQKAIPQKDLERILAESLIQGSVIDNFVDKGKAAKAKNDSIDYHSELLKKYGYTLDDFSYTITAMTMRKSNPLEDILNNVLKSITELSVEAEFKYKVAKRYDSLALAMLRDTIFVSDSIYRGKLTDIDTLYLAGREFKVGTYSVCIDYNTMADYRYPQKALRYYFADSLHLGEPEDMAGRQGEMRTIWMSRSQAGRKVEMDYELTRKSRDSMVLYFTETKPTYVKQKVLDGLPKDTSFIKHIEVVYTPEIGYARSEYFKTIFGEDFLVYKIQTMGDSLLNKSIRVPLAIDSTKLPGYEIKKDSISVDSLSHGGITEERSSDVQ